MNPAQVRHLAKHLRHYMLVRRFRKEFYCFEHIGVAATKRFEGEHTPFCISLAHIAQQDIDEIHHEERQIGRIGDCRVLHVHEIVQPPVLFGVPEGKLDLESQTVIGISLPYRTFELIMQHVSAIGVLASGAGRSAPGTLLEANGRP